MKKQILIDIDTDDKKEPIVISMVNTTSMHYPIDSDDVRESIVKALKNYLSNVSID